MLGRNLFHILRNIFTVIGIACRGYSCKCGTCVWLIIIDVRIYTKYFYVGDIICKGVRAWEGVYEGVRSGEGGVIKVIRWFLV